METWQHFLGVRSREVKTVWLFFLHNFLLGIGTILVYVVANVILLEHNPARSLPLGYGMGALAMLGVGQLYTYAEHRWPLRTLATRTLGVVVCFTGLLGTLLLLGHSVTAAVVLMAGYRVIYLLTNLEFWGLSAVVFNVRQGRRLFSVISSGDMPAKALGAVLAIFVHAQLDLLFLLLVAFGAYVAALGTQRLVFQSHVVEVRPAPVRPAAPESAPVFRGVLGSMPLVACMGLSGLAITAVATGVEFSFLVHVKQKLQDQNTVLQYVGGVLALTYLAALLGKLLLTRQGLDRLGLPRTLLLLPLTALAGVALFGALPLLDVGPAGRLVYFCALYLGLEVLRRAVFEPVFLVLFQPLAPVARLRGHTLVKGVYEPLGMGLTGLLLAVLYHFPTLHQGVLFGWMGMLLLGVVLLLGRVHRYYLAELKTVLSHRFAGPAPILTTAEALEVREEVDESAAGMDLPDAEAVLVDQPLDSNTALQHPDLAVRQAAIRACLTANVAHAAAHASLQELAASAELEQRLAALGLLAYLAPAGQVTLLRACVHSLEPRLLKAASRAAAETPTREVVNLFIALLDEKAVRKLAADTLVDMGGAVLPVLETALQHYTDYPLLRRLAVVCARLGIPASRRVLVGLAQHANLTRRAAALHALSRFEAVATEAPLFQHLMQKEMRLAQQLLHGMLGANVELRSCLKYELTKVQQRLFGLLLQLYDRQPILDAQRSIARAGQERQANALEILDNLIPRPLYQGLQALVDVGRLSKKVQTFDQLLGPLPPESIVATILARGDEVFAPWTISVALRQWQPSPATVALLHAYLQAPNQLVRESAEDVLALLPARYPAVYAHWLSLHPLPAAGGGPEPPAPRVPAVERILLLKHTSLFAQTPENVLSSITPIMQEVAFMQGQQVFAKGDLVRPFLLYMKGKCASSTGSTSWLYFARATSLVSWPC
ncbi:HEAT repeat domain-containing protein [Hymenobacter sp. AT01-02]|uniref:HEAT repeat domain-containing protein n=1 Tax=Hymenobacter sp. AT01-02 TaxID=1571877 RepID=UPI0006E437F4|nr:HEAT repeat domain-containing protein [Hymenobacter sp. AT01-02]